MEFEKLGIEFKVITEEMDQDCLDFMNEHFLPDEPMSRSLGFTRNWLIDELYFKDAIKNRTSLAAVDKDGKILGARIGKIVRKDEWSKWIMDKIVFNFLSWMTWLVGRSTSMHGLWIMLMILKYLEFDTWSMFGKLNCQAIYEAKALCSSRTHGVKGLGTELVRRAEELAKDKGCSYSYVMVTGIYSARVFDKLGYNKVKELEYAEFKDNIGELYLKDTREHTHCTIYLKSLD